MNSFLEKEFGFSKVECKKLNGYDNINYLVTTANHKYIFKTYNFSQELFDLAAAESEVLLFLEDVKNKYYPAPKPFANGAFVKSHIISEKRQVSRMLSYLEGEFLGNIKHTRNLFESLGAFLANLDLQLQNFNSYAIKSRVWEWDIQHLELNKKYICDIKNAKDRKIIRYFFLQFDEVVRPYFPELRKQVIHNDANEWNILAQNGIVSGLIDFGDIAYSFLVNEVAIAITYACYDKEKPLEWACIILESYHNILPLEEKEIDVLYYLIAARLCISVCNSAHAKTTNPNNAYLSVSEKSAWEMIYRWLEINPINAKNSFKKATGHKKDEVPQIDTEIFKRHQHISPILSLSYKEPIYMKSSAFQYMYDVYGNTYLDAYNNIPHVGHSHPSIVEAGQRQMAKLNTNTRYLYDGLAAYSEHLLSKFPKTLNKVFFVNSGSAASDLAIRLAKYHTRYEDIMVMETGYHGNTQSSIDISDYKFNNPKGQGKKKYIIKTDIPDTYKGKFTKNNQNPGKQYGQEAIDLISNSKNPIAAFISEPIVGCAGQVPLANGYLEIVYPAIRKQGGVCISDEVQTGFGRLGDYFWGYEAQGVVPDIVILGKPIANGHPMGAVVCTNEIASSFEKGVEFFSSFGGNPVSCAIANAVLEVIEEEKLQENAKIVGDYYKSLLKELIHKYPCVGDVRGSGLFLGVEIVMQHSKLPDTDLANHIKNELRKRKILISTDGIHDNVLKTKPPLCFTKNDAEKVVLTIDNILKAYCS